jgi:hypothetical protein
MYTYARTYIHKNTHTKAESFVVVKDELHEGETLIANSSSRPHDRAAATSKPVSLPVNLA